MRFTLVILSALFCFSTATSALPAKAKANRDEKIDLNKDSDEAIMAAAEKLVAEGGRLKTEDVKVEDAEATAPKEQVLNIPAAKEEADLPVFNKSEKQAKSESSLLLRLLASLAFIGVVGGVLIFAAKRFGQVKNKGGEKTRIEMLHQFHLGPKKSLALIRVAGEAILIGCTDHSINMIKPITIIDEELEGILGKGDFNGFLEDEFSVADSRTALNPRA